MKYKQVTDRPNILVAGGPPRLASESAICITLMFWRARDSALYISSTNHLKDRFDYHRKGIV